MKQTLDSLTASNSLLPEKMVMEKESSGLPVFASFLVRGTAVRLFQGAFLLLVLGEYIICPWKSSQPNKVAGL